MAETPSVLFILSDQHNAKVLGHKDHPDVQTPNLDRLAGEGVRYESAQTVTRFKNTVNADGKIHPDRVRDIRGGNYT